MLPIRTAHFAVVLPPRKRIAQGISYGGLPNLSLMDALSEVWEIVRWRKVTPHHSRWEMQLRPVLTTIWNHNGRAVMTNGG